MHELTYLIDDLRALTLAQLMATSRQERARLALERRGLEARLKELVEQLGEDARWEVVAYESWTDELVALLLRRGRMSRAA